MEKNPVVQFMRLNPEKDADVPLPRYMTDEAAGMDICTSIETDVVLGPGGIELLPTGFAMAMPSGYEAQIRPRSGLAVKHGIGIINSPGTVDSDYRGEVRVAVINLGKENFTFKRGDRIAQMLIKPVYHARVEVVETLEDTERGSGGFGHTGI